MYGLQRLKLIFKPNSISYFVLARNPASMLQIRNTTYQNVPQSLNYAFRYFVSSFAAFEMQQFATFWCTSRKITFLTMLGPSNGPRAMEFRMFLSTHVALIYTGCTQGHDGRGIPLCILCKAKQGRQTKTFEIVIFRN